MNKIRKVLLICNILYIMFGIIGFAFLVPGTTKLVETDAKQELVNNVTFVNDAIRNDSVEHNYGLTVYTIPRDGNRKLKTDMYTFYIIDEEGDLLYTSNPKFKKDINYRQYDYIDKAFIVQDHVGDTKGIQGNDIHFITARTVVRLETYVLVYEIDRDKIQRDVLLFVLIFTFGYIVSIFVIIGLSWWIDKQYKTILNHQDEIIEAYRLLDDTGETTEPYLSRIKKILHSFAFTTAVLFAINKGGVTIFRNRATLDAQRQVFGRVMSLPQTPDDSLWVDYRDEWDIHVTELLTSDKLYVEWDSKTYDYLGEAYYTKNRIKKIVVDNEPILICEIQDITDVTLANVEIQKYIEYLLTIFNTVHDVILVTDYIGTVENANNSVQDVFGYTLMEITGKNIEVIIKSDCKQLAENHFLCNGIKKDGTMIKVEIHQNPLILPEESKLQLLVIQDVTEREHLKEQLYASISLTTDTMKAMAGNI